MVSTSEYIKRGTNFSGISSLSKTCIILTKRNRLLLLAIKPNPTELGGCQLTTPHKSLTNSLKAMRTINFATLMHLNLFLVLGISSSKLIHHFFLLVRTLYLLFLFHMQVPYITSDFKIAEKHNFAQPHSIATGHYFKDVNFLEFKV